MFLVWGAGFRVRFRIRGGCLARIWGLGFGPWVEALGLGVEVRVSLIMVLHGGWPKLVKSGALDLNPHCSRAWVPF